MNDSYHRKKSSSRGSSSRVDPYPYVASPQGQVVYTRTSPFMDATPSPTSSSHSRRETSTRHRRREYEEDYYYPSPDAQIPRQPVESYLPIPTDNRIYYHHLPPPQSQPTAPQAYHYQNGAGPYPQVMYQIAENAQPVTHSGRAPPRRQPRLTVGGTSDGMQWVRENDRSALDPDPASFLGPVEASRRDAGPGRSAHVEPLPYPSRQRNPHMYPTAAGPDAYRPYTRVSEEGYSKEESRIRAWLANVQV